MQIHKVESFTRKPCSAKQRHAREWKCYPSVCPKQPSGHQPTGLWSDSKERGGSCPAQVWCILGLWNWLIKRHNFPFNLTFLGETSHKNKVRLTHAKNVTETKNHWQLRLITEASCISKNLQRFTRIDIHFISISGCLYLLHDVVTIGFIVFLYQPLGKHVSSAPIKHPQLRFKEPHCWDFWIPPVVFLFAHSPCSIGERRSRVKARFCWTGWTYARYLKWSKLWDLRIQNDNYRITFNGH